MPAYKVPKYLVDDYGATNLWDYRNGFLGDDGHVVPDVIGGADMNFNGGTSTSSIYTANQYICTFDSAQRDYFRTSSRITLTNDSSITKLSMIAWIDVTDLSENRAIWSHYNTTTGNAAISIVFWVRPDGGLGAFIAGTGNANTAAGLITVSTGMIPVGFVYDGTLAAAERIKFFVNSSTLLSNSGNDPNATLDRVTAEQCLGAWIGTDNRDRNRFHGDMSLCMTAVGTAWTESEIQELIDNLGALSGN